MATKTWNTIIKWLDIQVSYFYCMNTLFVQVDNLKGNTNKRSVIDAVVSTTFW